MELRRRLRTPAALALVAIGVGACTAVSAGPAASSGSSTTSTTATTVAAGTSGTASTTTTTLPISYATNATVSIAVSHLPANFNPWTPAGSDSVTQMIMEQVWPEVSVLDNKLTTQICTTLTTICPSQLLVSAEPISLDPMTVVYQISPKAKWSDGIPVTGADFSYLRNEIVAEASELPAIDPVEGYLDISKITTSGSAKKTVTVVFSKPYADWQSLFNYLVPEHVASSGGFTSAFTGRKVANLVSAGPYRITQVIPGREVVLARNPSYWGPKAGIARLIFRVEKTEQDTLNALQKGTVTVAQLPPGSDVERLVDSSTDLLSETTLTPELWQLAFNETDPVMGVSDIRQAIAEAIDRHQLLADTLGLISGDSGIVGNRIFGLGVGGGVGNDATYSEADLQSAEQLLGEAGYQYGANGLAELPGKGPLHVVLVGPEGDSIAASVEAEIQAELLQVGIEVTIDNEPIRTLLGTTLPSDEYQIALVPYDITPYLSTTAALYTNPVGVAAAPPETEAGLSAMKLAQVPGRVAATGSAVSGAVSRDVLGLEDARLPALFADASSNLNPLSADDVYNEIDIDLWDDMATLPLYELPVTTVYRNALVGLTPAETWPSFLYDAQSWNWELYAPPTSTTTTTTTLPSTTTHT